MSHSERRRADRVEVGIPVQLYTHRGFVDAEIRDLSRSGLRIRARVHALGFEPTADLVEAAQGIAQALGPHFALDMDYRKLGPLLQRQVALTRIGLPTDAPMCVEVCCAFLTPLEDTENAILGAPLRPLEETAAWCPPESLPAQCAGVVTMRPQGELEERLMRVPVPKDVPATKPGARPRQRYRALVSGTQGDSLPAFFCHTDLITAIGVRVCLPRPTDADGVKRAMADLIRRHGTSVELRLLGDDEDVWAGSARVTGVELPPHRADLMLVTLAYDTTLSRITLGRLGLIDAA